ncbi:MAG: hypothetical protein LBQ48_00345 [Oscillospiraceae bacterium]|jgi:hypothetical protein|nr:hypothetical protein [Oscillospiraceae bacterium]
MKLFDIYLAYMVFDDGNGGKEPPVLIMDLEDDLAAIYNVTSQYEKKSEYIRSLYYPIKNWKEAGLDKQSYVDTVKARYVSQKSLENKTPIGTLSEYDKIGLIEFLATH